MGKKEMIEDQERIKKGNFNVYQSDKNGNYYFNLQAGNNEIILQSEGYKTKQAALNGIEAIKDLAKDATIKA